MKTWYRSGSPWIWLNAAAVAASFIMVVGLLGLIAVRGLVHFWPHPVHELQYEWNGKLERVIGEIQDEETVTVQRLRDAGVPLPDDVKELIVTRYLVKIGNRDIYGVDFRNIVAPLIKADSTPEDLVLLERWEYGNFYGYLKKVKKGGEVVASGDAAWSALQPLLERANRLHDEVHRIERDEIGSVNYRLEQLRLKQRRYELDDALTPEVQAELQAERDLLKHEYEQLQGRLAQLRTDLQRDSIVMEIQTGQEVEIPLGKVVHAYRPNSLGFFGRIGHFFAKMWEFVSTEPREANTEGGVFPAIFGTVTMVLVMSVLVTPLGVVAAVYLREYAREGPIVRLIYIAVNNLAGVPSIVYGVFGLGFFVYFIGGNIDQLFFPEALPAPTFGTPGLLWASLTLALLTLPVVIVSTEEGLARIPRAIREGSLALGATKAETLWRVVLPMASPAMMTGLILAVARAAGEVAPLMLVGVVKLAPSLPIDGNFPFIHLDRKFMHLGFHIYDVGFQSPNVEAARPLVYATALLLVLLIIVLNFTAIGIRNHLREKYRALEN
ncbi:MAG: phosphate ABC transporter permease PstA [Gammaproteobacteria bacterium]|nr:MAG: phosphate ABC transporter permease PstA [Gammaproteobacteria bacterium]